ncbi:MAG: hypothetical protein BGO01_13500 [Armatimonadetes bacterium 55-13]|nr:MAG: hypothetical protein BGO01_13500 [Armatimonadetes bacterium 55-13]
MFLLILIVNAGFWAHMLFVKHEIYWLGVLWSCLSILCTFLAKYRKDQKSRPYVEIASLVFLLLFGMEAGRLR